MGMVSMYKVPKVPVAAIAVKVLRIASSKTQEEVAREACIDRALVSRIESGERLKAELVLSLLSASGGVEMLDWLLEQLSVVRDWLKTNRNNDQLLYV